MDIYTMLSTFNIMCSEGWYYRDEEVDGECPKCGTPTVDGEAQSGCHWSSIECEECGDAPCNGSC